MPELPEVETVRRALAPVMTGATITKADIRRPNLRWDLAPDLAARLEGQNIVDVTRRAKIIQVWLAQDVMLIHLGMSGSIRISDHAPNGRAHDHIEWQVSQEAVKHWITFNDPRRFGYVDILRRADHDSHPSLASLGPEPLSDAFSEAYLEDRLQGKTVPIKSFLLDQRHIAGLGNIYVCEALFRAGISPRRRADTVIGKRARRLLPSIRDVLEEAIAQGGTSLRDHRQPDGKLGYFVQSLDVYGREGAPCHSCATPIKAIRQSGRSSFYCPLCQR